MKLNIFKKFLLLPLLIANISTYSDCKKFYEKKINEVSVHKCGFGINLFRRKVVNPFSNYHTMKYLIDNTGTPKNSFTIKLCRDVVSKRIDLDENISQINCDLLIGDDYTTKFYNKLTQIIYKGRMEDNLCPNDEPMDYNTFLSEIEKIYNDLKVDLPKHFYVMEPEYYNHFVKTPMNEFEKEEVLSYIENNKYGIPNKLLRSGKYFPPSSSSSDKVNELDSLISGFKKLDVYKETTSLYRGTGVFIDEVINPEELEIGKVYTNDSILSFSKSYIIAKQFGDNSKNKQKIIKIISSRSGRNIDGTLFDRKKEKEVIFLPGTKFVYKGYEKRCLFEKSLRSRPCYVYEEI